MKIIENGIYRDMTTQEIAQLESLNTPEIKIEQLKQQLAETDYKAIKYAEGVLSEDEYAKLKQQRQEWRQEINRLEAQK